MSVPPRREPAMDRFERGSYFEIVDRLRRTHRPLRFADVAGGWPGGPAFLLRHDVDYSLPAALSLAEEEARHGLFATYFLLPSTFLYNLLWHENAKAPSRFVELGHEVGLHYDVRFLAAFPVERRLELVEALADLLGRLSGRPVVSISMHQPGLFGRDPLGESRFLNAYEERFFKEIPYLSDSGRAFRDVTARLLAGLEPLPERFQLVLHPENWQAKGPERVALYAGVHRDLRELAYREESELLEQLERHTGVLEHEARLERLRGGPR